jgi:putative ABC transport system permease protein
MKLLRSLILRPLRRDLPRTALTILAVALGVAVVVAIDLAGDAATGSFRSSLQTLGGKTDLAIRANGGIDERWMGPLTSLPVNAQFSPVMEAQATIAGAGGVPLYGLDLLGAPGVTLSRDLSRLLGGPHLVTLNIAGHERSFAVDRIADSPGEFAALDIAEAQQALGRYGKLDRIDVTVAPSEDFAAVERTIRSLLPPAYLIERPGARNEENLRMLRAFRWNLRVLSYISLVVGRS